MARSGSSNKVGSGRNKGKMAPQDGKDLKGRAKRNKGRQLEMEEVSGGGGLDPLVPPPTYFRSF